MLPPDTRMARLLAAAEELAQMGSWDTDFASGTHTLSENLRVAFIDRYVELGRINPEPLG